MRARTEERALRKVREAATAAPVVETSMTLQQASAAMLEAQAEAAVVVQDGITAGLITAEHVAHALADGHDAAVTRVGAIAERDPLLARGEETVLGVHERMRAAGCALAIAVGPTGEPLGLVRQ